MRRLRHLAACLDPFATAAPAAAAPAPPHTPGPATGRPADLSDPWTWTAADWASLAATREPLFDGSVLEACASRQKLLTDGWVALPGVCVPTPAPPRTPPRPPLSALAAPAGLGSMPCSVHQTDGGPDRGA